MSVTVHQTPEAYSLIYNPQMFLALSTQIAQPNFVYRVVITDLVSSDTLTYDVPADPDGYCRFNGSPFGRRNFSHYIPMNLYGWQKSTSIRKIRVNIGEYYGTTPAYTAGSNFDWICWNGVENVEDWCDFDYTNYIYDESASNFKYLSSQLPAKAYEDRSDYFYVNTQGAGDFERIRVRTYTTSGSLEGEFYIDNPHDASTTYTDKYLCIDVGVKGLTEIASMLVTVNAGALPIIKSTTGSYIIAEANPTSGVDVSYRDIKTYTIGCEPRFPIYTIHFVRKNGAVQTIHFNKRSDFSSTKEQEFYGVYPYVRSGSTYTYSRSTRFQRPLATETNDQLLLKTDWLTSGEVDLYRELFDSPHIWLDLGSDQEYRILKLVDNTYKLNKSWNEKLFSLSMNFEYTNTNYRQL